jgi:hypothetical protein
MKVVHIALDECEACTRTDTWRNSYAAAPRSLKPDDADIPGHLPIGPPG